MTDDRSRPTVGMASLSALPRAGAGGRTSDRVFAELAAAIRELRLRPGEPLSETELARQLGVSRTPIREALSRLVDNVLVVVVPQVGTTVSLIHLGEVREAQFIREHLEVAAFSAACSLTDVDRTPLLTALSRQKAAHKRTDFTAFFAADEDFHAGVFALSGHSGAWDAIQRSKFQLDRVRRLATAPLNVGHLIREHTAIARALAEGDLERGRALVAAHARRVLAYAPLLAAEFPQYFDGSGRDVEEVRTARASPPAGSRARIRGSEY